MQDLFDLTVSNYKEISKARRSIELLKACWDMVGMVVMTL